MKDGRSKSARTVGDPPELIAKSLSARIGGNDKLAASARLVTFGNEPMLTGDRLRKLLTYDPRTGVFRWKVDRNSRRSEGDIAGHEHSRTKRRVIAVDGHLYQAGRLAWLYMKGTWPNHLINCVNGDPSDIRWANLRQITLAQRQASRPAKNKLGMKGVWKTGHGKYAAEIRVNRKKKYLGQFDTLQKASVAYAKAAKIAFGSFARAR